MVWGQKDPAAAPPGLQPRVRGRRRGAAGQQTPCPPGLSVQRAPGSHLTTRPRGPVAACSQLSTGLGLCAASALSLSFEISLFWVVLLVGQEATPLKPRASASGPHCPVPRRNPAEPPCPGPVSRRSCLARESWWVDDSSTNSRDPPPPDVSDAPLPSWGSPDANVGLTKAKAYVDCVQCCFPSYPHSTWPVRTLIHIK